MNDQYERNRKLLEQDARRYGEPAKPVTLTGPADPQPGTVDWSAPPARMAAQVRLEAELDRERRTRVDGRRREIAALKSQQAWGNMSEEDVATRMAEQHAQIQADRRERIATAAMQGLLAKGYWGDGEFGFRAKTDVASQAVSLADALIAELSKPAGGAL